VSTASAGGRSAGATVVTARRAAAALVAAGLGSGYGAACAAPRDGGPVIDDASHGAGPALGAAGPASPSLRLELRWTIRPDGPTHVLSMEENGTATLRSSRVEGYETVEEPPVELRAAPSLAEEVDALVPELSRLPRFAHTSSSVRGVLVELTASRGDSRVRHRSFNSDLSTLERLVAVLRSGLGEPAASALEPLARLERFRDLPRFEYTPGRTPVGRLMEPLEPPSRDLELRILALERIVEAATGPRVAEPGKSDATTLAEPPSEAAAAFALLPRLRALYDASAARGPEPDYFLAKTLLRLGDLAGVERVLDVSLSMHPDWALDAGGALAAAFGRDVLPPYDFQSPDDPRPAAVAEFRAWVGAHGARLRFDRATGRYELE
jgi:hypothetical protein